MAAAVSGVAVAGVAVAGALVWRAHLRGHQRGARRARGRASGGCRGHGSSSRQRVTMPFVNVSRATSERREGSAATKSVRRNPRGREGPCFVAWICRLRTGLGGTRARAPRGRTSAWRARHGPRDRTGAGRPCHTSPHPYNAVHGESIPMTVTAAPLQYVGPKHTKQKPRAWRAARRARTCL